MTQMFDVFKCPKCGRITACNSLQEKWHCRECKKKGFWTIAGTTQVIVYAKKVTAFEASQRIRDRKALEAGVKQTRLPVQSRGF
jgi:ribosomal protein L37AE/L43A